MSATPQELEQFQRAVNAETVRNQAHLIRELEDVLRQIVTEYTALSCISFSVIEKAQRLVE